MLSQEQARRFEIPAQFLAPILPSPRHLESDEILADRHGNPRTSKQSFLIKCNLPEVIVREKYPKLWDYFQSGVESGISAGYLCTHRSPWYAQEDRPASPFLCTYMGRPSSKSTTPFRFILNRSKATAANVYLVLYPKPILSAILDQNPEVIEKVWKALCSITTESMTGEGRLYGGGLHKIEPKELGRVSADIIFKEIGHGVAVEKQKRLFT